jgi:ferritin
MFEQTLKHERYITKCINELLQLAIAEKDAATQIMLQWFITEQVEEEANPAEIIAQIKMVGPSTGGLFMLDKQLGKREAAK